MGRTENPIPRPQSYGHLIFDKQATNTGDPQHLQLVKMHGYAQKAETRSSSLTTKKTHLQMGEEPKCKMRYHESNGEESRKYVSTYRYRKGLSEQGPSSVRIKAN